jgi:uncharacterized membrane protein
MSLLSDIIKAIPHAAHLQDKVRELEAKNGALETENAILKDKSREEQLKQEKLEAEIVKLVGEIDGLKRKDDLDETDVRIVAYMARAGGSAHTSDIARALDLHPVVLKKSIGALKSYGLINETHLRRTTMITGYKLTQRGLEYAVENGLIAESS